MKILVIGACGQIGTELVVRLREIHGRNNIIAADIREASMQLLSEGPFEKIDVTDKSRIEDVCLYHEVTEIYLMAAMLSATGEKYPKKAWDLNMGSLFNVLDMAREGKIQKVFWPSSIAVFGPSTPKTNTPQTTIMEPTTVYGISKQTGERWCEYYHSKYGVDVRSLRYPGLISWKTIPGGGTTDYAVDIFHKAVATNSYQCFLKEATELPMMYMDDAISATIDLMTAPEEAIKQRGSYNVAGMSFDPKTLAHKITERLPGFTITYVPDFRQDIADSWPASIDDTEAREDWGWHHKYDIDATVNEMLLHLKTV